MHLRKKQVKYCEMVDFLSFTHVAILHSTFIESLLFKLIHRLNYEKWTKDLISSRREKGAILSLMMNHFKSNLIFHAVEMSLSYKNSK